MEIIKVVISAILIVFVIIIIKQIKPELAIGITILGSISLLLYILSFFSPIVEIFDKIINSTGLNTNLFTILLKIIGIGYLVEFCADICSDSGNSAIANKVILGGKVFIFILAIPIITDLFDIIIQLLEWFLYQIISAIFRSRKKHITKLR